MKRIRLLPLVIVAVALLLGLKAVQWTIGDRHRPREVVRVDAVTGEEVDMTATGSAGGGEAKKDDGHGAPAAGGDAPGVQPSKVDTKVTGDKPTEAKPVPGQELLSEIEILKKLAERRKQLDEMERQLQMREDLLTASEGRIGRRIEELKGIEDKIGADVKAKEVKKVQELSDLVKMYESMKAKDAARVFDKLDISLLAEIARQMNPKKLGDVVAKMSAEQAEKLTVELANRRPQPEAVGRPVDQTLPKIQGRSG